MNTTIEAPVEETRAQHDRPPYRRGRRHSTEPHTPRPTERPVDDDGFAARNAVIIFIGDSIRPGRRRTRGGPEGIHAVYQFDKGPLKSYWFVVRGETCSHWRVDVPYLVDLVWGGREKTILIPRIALDATARTEAAANGIAVEVAEAPVHKVTEARELEVHPLIKPDDGSVAYVHTPTGSPCFLAHTEERTLSDMTKVKELGRIDLLHPIYMVGTRGTFYLLTRDETAVSLLREFGGRNPAHQDWIRHGGLWMRPINSRTYEVGWQNEERGRWEIHQLQSLEQILDLNQGEKLPKKERLEAAYQEAKTLMEARFGEAKQAQYRDRIRPERWQAWHEAHAHNARNLDLAYNIKGLAIRQYEETREAIRQTGGQATNMRARVAALRAGIVSAPTALQTMVITYDQAKEAWAEVVRIGLEDTELDPDEWGGYLASAFRGERLILPEEADSDDMVVCHVLQELDMPDEYWMRLLRHIRVTIQGKSSDLYPLASDTPAEEEAAEPVTVDPSLIATWRQAFVKRVADRDGSLATAVAGALEGSPTDLKDQDDTWLLERLVPIAGEPIAKRIIRLIRAA